MRVPGATPLTEKPVPVTDAEVMATAALPVEVSVTDLLTAVPTETLPKASEDVLSVRAEVEGFS